MIVDFVTLHYNGGGGVSIKWLQIVDYISCIEKYLKANRIFSSNTFNASIFHEHLHFHFVIKHLRNTYVVVFLTLYFVLSEPNPKNVVIHDTYLRIQRYTLHNNYSSRHTCKRSHDNKDNHHIPLSSR